MPRKGKNWNHIKYSVKPQKVEQQRKTKIGTRNNGNEQKRVTNMVDTNPVVSIITLNGNCLKYTN